MTDRPILFSAPMIRALLDGRKTQTRRLAWRRLPDPADDKLTIGKTRTAWMRTLPRDRLWAKEAWRAGQGYDGVKIADMAPQSRIWYEADGNRPGFVKGEQKRSSIHMPRRFSRLTLIVEDVRLQSLHDITEEDALAEGALKGKATGRIFNNAVELRMGAPVWRCARDWYACLWESIHGGNAWAANPEVIAITFKVVQQNIDAITAESAHA